jgi:hypothetical protein
VRKKFLFCHSERSEESLFDLTSQKEREIPRFAQKRQKAWAVFSAACEACTTEIIPQ